MQIRLNKFISQAGIASRRAADRLIEEGRVKVNGRIVQELGCKIDDQKDRVEINGKKIEKDEGSVYILLHKPAGCLVTLKDPFGRPTVLDFLPSIKKRVFPVGRLDSDSDGVLLLTNDGELANRLTHPRYNIKKTYIVKIKGEPDLARLMKLEKGIILDGEKTAPAKVILLVHNPKKSLLKIEIHEGRKREVRRMCEAIGHTVLELRRIAFAGLTLGKLKPGQWRYLSGKEVMKLKAKVGLK